MTIPCEHIQVEADCAYCIERLEAAIQDIAQGGPRLLQILCARIQKEREEV